MPITKFVVLPTGPGTEDKPGTLGRVARAVAEAGISIEAYAADAAGIRILCNDPAKASQALQAKGFRPQTVECFEIAVPNRPGELARIGEELGRANVNVVSSFGLANAGTGRVFVRVDDTERARAVLERQAQTVAR